MRIKLPKSANKNWVWLGGIILLGLIVRLLLAKTNVFEVDLVTYQFWSLDLVKSGLANFYQVADSDYPPGYLYILLLVGKFFYWFLNHGVLFNIDLVYKLPGIGADIINIYLAYLLVREYRSEKAALVVASIFAFFPAIIINSTLWGQVDGIMTFLLLLSLYLIIKNKWLGSAVVLAFAQTFKPVAVLCIPLFLLYLWKKDQKGKILGYGLAFGVVILALFLPFSSNITHLLDFAVERFLVTSTRYPQLTINAFNWWAIFSTSTDGISRIGINEMNWPINVRIAGYLFFLGLYLPQLIKLWISRNSKGLSVADLVQTTAITYLSMFLFFTGMHERHMYYGVAFALLLLPILNIPGRLLIMGLATIYTLNLIYAYRLISPAPLYLTPTTLVTLSLTNVLLLLILCLGWRFLRVRLNGVGASQ